MTPAEIREAVRAVVDAGEKAHGGKWSVIADGITVQNEGGAWVGQSWCAAFLATAGNARPALAALAGMCVLDVETVRVLVKAAQQWRDEMVVMDDEPEHVAITAALAAAEAEVARVEGR